MDKTLTKLKDMNHHDSPLTKREEYQAVMAGGFKTFQVNQTSLTVTFYFRAKL